MFSDEKKREMFCRYKGIDSDDFQRNLVKYAEEFNAFCAGIKACIYGI